MAGSPLCLLVSIFDPSGTFFSIFIFLMSDNSLVFVNYSRPTPENVPLLIYALQLGFPGHVFRYLFLGPFFSVSPRLCGEIWFYLTPAQLRNPRQSVTLSAGDERLPSSGHRIRQRHLPHQR